MNINSKNPDEILQEMLQGCINNLDSSLLEKSQGKDIVMFIGSTKAGKSSVVNLLMGNPLEAIKSIGDNFRIKKGDTSSGPEIGLTSVSATTVPRIWPVDGITGIAVDAPGFDDNRGISTDVINSYLLSEMIKNAKSAKIILTVDVHDLLSDNISNFITSIERIYTIIPHSPENYKSIGLVITKDREVLNVNEVISLMEQKILKENQIVTVIREHILYFCNHREQIVFFKMPGQEGPIETEEIISIKHMIETLSWIPDTVLSEAKPGISLQSRIFLLQSRQHLTQMKELDEMLVRVGESLIRPFRNLDINTLSQHEIIKFLEDIHNIERKLNNLPDIQSLESLVHHLSMLSSEIREAVCQDNIIRKIKFVQFVDGILGLREENIYKVKASHKVSTIKFFFLNLSKDLKQKQYEMVANQVKETIQSRINTSGDEKFIRLRRSLQIQQDIQENYQSEMNTLLFHYDSSLQMNQREGEAHVQEMQATFEKDLKNKDNTITNMERDGKSQEEISCELVQDNIRLKLENERLLRNERERKKVESEFVEESDKVNMQRKRSFLEWLRSPDAIELLFDVVNTICTVVRLFK